MRTALQGTAAYQLSGSTEACGFGIHFGKGEVDDAQQEKGARLLAPFKSFLVFIMLAVKIVAELRSAGRARRPSPHDS